MPRPNKPRDILGEDYLAERVRLERTKRGWTPERLATEMTDAGYPLQTSAVYKIEGGTPRRRITVEELIGFSWIFGIPVGELLTDPSTVATREALAALDEWLAARERSAQAAAQMDAATARLVAGGG